MTTKHIKLSVKLVYKARGTLYTLLYVPLTTFRKKIAVYKISRRYTSQLFWLYQSS